MVQILVHVSSLPVSFMTLHEWYTLFAARSICTCTRRTCSSCLHSIWIKWVPDSNAPVNEHHNHPILDSLFYQTLESQSFPPRIAGCQLSFDLFDNLISNLFLLSNSFYPFMHTMRGLTDTRTVRESRHRAFWKACSLFLVIYWITWWSDND